MCIGNYNWQNVTYQKLFRAFLSGSVTNTTEICSTHLKEAKRMLIILRFLFVLTNCENQQAGSLRAITPLVRQLTSTYQVRRSLGTTQVPLLRWKQKIYNRAPHARTFWLLIVSIHNAFG